MWKGLFKLDRIKSQIRLAFNQNKNFEQMHLDTRFLIRPYFAAKNMMHENKAISGNRVIYMNEHVFGQNESNNLKTF